MKQEFLTLVRVFDQTKIKKSHNLFWNLLKQAVMSDTNQEKLKSVIYPFSYLNSPASNEPQKWTSWHRRQLEGKVCSKQTQQPKGVWPQSFIRSFPCFLQSDMPASKVSDISLMLVKSAESHTLSHISHSSYTESLSVITFNGKTMIFSTVLF